MSLGEDRVRIKFNPSDSSRVFTLKTRAAELIDCIESMRIEGSEDGEFQRLCREAQTGVEIASMWAVKAATF